MLSFLNILLASILLQNFTHTKIPNCIIWETFHPWYVLKATLCYYPSVNKFPQIGKDCISINIVTMVSPTLHITRQIKQILARPSTHQSNTLPRSRQFGQSALQCGTSATITCWRWRDDVQHSERQSTRIPCNGNTRQSGRNFDIMKNLFQIFFYHQKYKTWMKFITPLVSHDGYNKICGLILGIEWWYNGSWLWSWT